jgi:hypothetical protein
MEGSEPGRINRTLEPLGITKRNGETVATTSTLKNCLFGLHTEEATGSIPVSPTTLPRPAGSLFRVITLRFWFFEGLVETARFLDRLWNVGYTSLCQISINEISGTV